MIYSVVVSDMVSATSIGGADGSEAVLNANLYAVAAHAWMRGFAGLPAEYIHAPIGDPELHLVVYRCKCVVKVMLNITAMLCYRKNQLENVS